MFYRLEGLTDRFKKATAVAIVLLGLMLGPNARAADDRGIAPLLVLLSNGEEGSSGISHPVVDTGQSACYGNIRPINCPLSGRNFYGQDAQYGGNQFSFQNNDDGTVSDLVTVLMRRNTTDANGDGTIDNHDKMTYSEARSYCRDLSLADRNDWRLPAMDPVPRALRCVFTIMSGWFGIISWNLSGRGK